MRRCKFLGNYTGWVQRVPANYNHFAYYQNSAFDCEFSGNYISYCVGGVGSGAYIGNGGGRFTVRGNTFDHIGNHPVYLMSCPDSIIADNKQFDCGSSFAVDGARFQIIGNQIHLNNTPFGAMSGLSLRNPLYCTVAGNTIFGKGDQVIIGLENLGAGSSIIGNTIANNTIHMSSGNDIYQAIRLGTAGITTSVRDNLIMNNRITADINSGTGIIKLVGTATDQVQNNNIIDNVILSSKDSFGVELKYGKNNIIKGNIYTNQGAYGAFTTIVGVYLDQSHDTVVEGNTLATTTSAHIVLYGAREIGTNAQVYKNRYLNNRINSPVTGRNLFAVDLVAGNGSEVADMKTSEAYAADTIATFRIKTARASS